MDAAENPRAVIGGNAPPEPTPFDLVCENVESVYLEAKNWLDGAAIETQGQADALGLLLDMARQAEKAAEELRVAEKKPHDDAAKAVQAKFKPLTDKTGRVTKACKDALTAWLVKIEAAKRLAAEEARREAEEKRLAAEAAVRAASGTSLEAREAAEEMLTDAKRADAAATRAENAKAQAKGGARAVGLRTSWRPELTDAREAARHYWVAQRPALEAFLTDLARADVARGLRDIPGFVVHEEKAAA